MEACGLDFTPPSTSVTAVGGRGGKGPFYTDARTGRSLYWAGGIPRHSSQFCLKLGAEEVISGNRWKGGPRVVAIVI